MLRGLALVALGTAVALLGHRFVPGLSPALLAVAVGVVAAFAGLPQRSAPGLQFASRHVLRAGVALLGLQLILGDIAGLGWPLLLVILAVVVCGIGGTLLLGRLLGVDSQAALLIACGFSICGAAAVAAVDGVRPGAQHLAGRREEDVARAVSLVVLCGSAVMLGLPLLAHLAGFDATRAGAWAGASIQEVGQVAVAGGLLGGTALQIAVVVKLGRVLLLAPVLLVVSAGRADEGPRNRRIPIVPGFVVVFVALVVLRAVVPVPHELLAWAAWVQQAALAAGMVALGAGLSPQVVRTTPGRVLALGVAAAVLVGLVGLTAAFVVPAGS